MSAATAKQTEALTSHLRYKLAQQFGTDRYDADFITGVLMQWLEEHNSALTGSGVRRLIRRGA